MTVRANKPAFNIREKLKELTQSIGLKGRELMRAATVQEARDLVSAGRRNLVINGACQIHQRGGTSTALIDSYPVDRFVINSAGLDQYAANFSQSAESPDGFSNSLRIEGTTPETAIGNGEYLRLQHRIEAQNLQHLGFGSSSAKSITVSFWVKSSIPGAYAFHIWQADTNELVNSRYYINAADTWEYKTFTYSGNSGGAINNDSGAGFILNWILDANTAFTAESGLGASWDTYNAGSHFAAGHTANFCGSNNNFYLTGVQLEVGKNATEFEHRSYGEELALCQRYFTRLYFPNSTYVAQGGLQNSSNIRGSMIHLPTTLRVVPPNASNAANPSITFSGTGNTTGLFTFLQPSTANPTTVGSIIMAGTTDSQIHVYGTNFTSLGSTGQTSQLYASNTAWINIDVEL